MTIKKAFFSHFMKSTVYFRLGESKFRVDAAHPLDKSLLASTNIKCSTSPSFDTLRDTIPTDIDP
jgi:hypothetical protein